MLGLNVSIRNDALKLIRDAIDAGTGPGKLKFYAGPRPETGGSATTLLGTVTCSDPCAPDPAAGVLTFSAFAEDPGAPASGVCSWARFTDGNDNFVTDCSVGKKFTENGNTTADSAVITNLPSTAKIDVGMAASRPGIPEGTTVLSVDSVSQVTLSNNATATASGVSIAFEGEGDILLNDNNISSGGPVRVSSGSITDGNA
ncbi:MAG: hypothetical protein MI799_22560 [Desulfobacterales bacterium]|nr:hypothetical protein [Desulfobacterales bacterium]